MMPHFLISGTFAVYLSVKRKLKSDMLFPVFFVGYIRDYLAESFRYVLQ